MSPATPAVTLGARVKSGRAIVVLLAGPAPAPRALDAREIQLCDPEIPDSRQPYHAGVGTEQTDTTKLKRLIGVVERCSRESVSRLLAAYEALGHRPRAIGLVVGSDVDPVSIANPHIRAHASEGRLFRTAVDQAARESGLRPSVFLERTLYQTATRALSRSEAEIKRILTALGKERGGPWRADEKAAAVAAWILHAGD